MVKVDFCRIIRIKKWFNFLLSALLLSAGLIIFSSGYARAEMTLMEDAELAGITATGFSKFTLSNGVNDVARIDLNLGVTTYTEIGNMQMGHWDNGAGTGWDQSWQSVAFGSETKDLTLNNFVLETKFDNISDSANRHLQSVTVGFSNVTGTISTDIGTFTGSIKGTQYNRAALGLTSITLTNEPFLVTLEIDKGVSFKIGW